MGYAAGRGMTHAAATARELAETGDDSLRVAIARLRAAAKADETSARVATAGVTSALQRLFASRDASVARNLENRRQLLHAVDASRGARNGPGAAACKKFCACACAVLDGGGG